jgi:SAM-dependent methyltransferase
MTVAGADPKVTEAGPDTGKIVASLLRIEHFAGGNRRLWWSTRAIGWCWGLGYDVRHGVETRRRVSSSDPERQSFESVVPWNLTMFLPGSSVTSSDVLLDVGSGKGRALLVAASRYPFKRVIGVEMSADLNRVAAENVRRYRGGELRPIDLVDQDVLDWKIPDDVSVLFLYNPFSGSVFERFITMMRQSLLDRPRAFRIIYVSPYMHQMVIDAGFTQSQKLGRVRVYRWIEPCDALSSCTNGSMQEEAQP